MSGVNQVPQRSGDDRGETQRPPETAAEDQRADGTGRRDARGHGVSQWLAGTAVRAGLTVIGVFLLLFAIGQAFGLPLLEFTAEALSSQTGRWLVVAFFAVLLIGAAQRIGTGT